MGVGGPAAVHTFSVPAFLDRPLGPVMMNALQLARAGTEFQRKKSFHDLRASIVGAERYYSRPSIYAPRGRELSDESLLLLDQVSQALEATFYDHVLQVPEVPEQKDGSSSLIVRAGAELMLAAPALLSGKEREIPFEGEVIPLLDVVNYGLLSVEAALDFVGGLLSELPVYLRQLHRRIELEAYGSFDLRRFIEKVPCLEDVEEWLAANPVERGFKLYAHDCYADYLSRARPARHAFAVSAFAFFLFGLGYMQSSFEQVFPLQFFMTLATYTAISKLDAKRWISKAQKSTELSAMLCVFPQLISLQNELPKLFQTLKEMKEE